MKYQLIVSFFVITASCANQSKKEVPQATPTAAPTNITSAAEATPVNPLKLKNTVMIDAFTCARDSDIRELYIEPIPPKGCKLWYSNKKDGPTAQSVSNIEHCEKVNKNIRRNLEVAKYKCQPLITSK